MLRITNAQFEALQLDAVSTFEASMMERCSEMSPLLAAVLGRDKLLAAIRAAAERARAHGFSFTGPVRLFIELSFLFGSGFDGDVQYPWAREALASGDPETQVGRANTLFELSMNANSQIHGPEGAYTRAALEKLQALLSAPPQLRADDFDAAVLAEMARVYPEKHAFVGEEALRSLIETGKTEATARGLSEPGDALLIALLMFAFGQGCLRDPLYPWISRALGGPPASLPARQLNDKALVWIRGVLANTATKGDRS